MTVEGSAGTAMLGLGAFVRRGFLTLNERQWTRLELTLPSVTRAVS